MSDIITREQARALSPITLAFFGDSVYEVLVRRKIVKNGSVNSAKLHKLSVEKVRASYQSGAVDRVLPLLTEDELQILKRGRNATGNTVPRSSNPREYRRATALEALFGYLSLIGEQARAEELFEVCYNEESVSGTDGEATGKTTE